MQHDLVTTLTESLAKAESRAEQSANEYEALRISMDALKVSWKKQLEGVKSELAVQLEDQRVNVESKRLEMKRAEEELRYVQVISYLRVSF